MKMCEKCKKNPASVHFSQTVGAKTVTLNLCASCAAKMGLGTPKVAFGDDLFASFPLFSHTSVNPEADLVCPRCHTSLSQIRRKGVFGCSECYDTFAKKLDLTPFVGQGYHGGRLANGPTSEPNNKENETDNKDCVSSMRAELKRALQEENYELAARLRDAIRAKEGA